MVTIEKIFKLAAIRRAIDSRFGEAEIHDGTYFDVMEKIDLPSEDGDYSEYDAVAIVTKQQAKFMQDILDENTAKIFYLNI
jgi:hypothetical protein